MDIFNEVRIRPNSNTGAPSESVVHEVTDLIIRINYNTGHVMLAERRNDGDESPEDFQFFAYIIGPVQIDEFGFTFKAVKSDKVYHVIVTRKGVYG